MKQSMHQSYDELPLYLNAKIVGAILGVSESSVYDLMRSKGFPTMRIGKRMIVSKADFIEWMKKQPRGGCQ